jgi:hypothetical protein
VWVNDSETSTFGLRLQQRDSVITGSHCGISQGGEKIDCALDNEETIAGIKRTNIFYVSFKSMFCVKSGKATISILSKGSKNHK